MAKVLKSAQSGKQKRVVHARRRDVLNERFDGEHGPIDSRHLLISALLPASVKLFLEDCEREVEELCGGRYEHGKQNQRWGVQPGSVVIANQRIALERPRVRTKDGHEVPLRTYAEFQDPSLFDNAVFAEGLKRVSQRDYQKGLSKIANSFGFKKSSVSRRWIRATEGELEKLQSRRLSEMDIRAVFIDGKGFRSHGVIIALGVASDGRKYVLGIYEASTESSANSLELLNDLERRGLASEGLVFVVDGGSGINKALDEKYECSSPERRRAIRIRCHAHKWRNIESALGAKAEKTKTLFWALRDAKDMAEAKVISDSLEDLLGDLNQSALKSYLEARNDLLAVHELKLTKSLRRFFSTTNPIESLNSLLEEDMRRVKKWKDSGHFQRWLATFCLASEKRMRRIKGHSSLPGVWVHLRSLTETKRFDTSEEVA